jgi:hypothetical protein
MPETSSSYGNPRLHFTKTILRYDLLPSSSYGNPRFRFTFTDGTAHNSMSNAGWCYAVGNRDMREGSAVEITLTPAGKIRVMRPTA